eukprot:TRINITY_DN20864_c0_g1_i2.p1 TRINITY_DN20864_c0_g1~~TRINITY_DN20864_c0_g1_i2.p1  ORF type:complete len:622 (-),score=73.23 TRINITY_DN20864_c0_g1_i2:200-2026(-)
MRSLSYHVVFLIPVLLFSKSAAASRTRHSSELNGKGAPSQFTIVSRIGSGQYGRVYQAIRHAEDASKTYALKELGPVDGSWDAGYELEDLIHRELWAYITLKEQAASAGREVAHTAVFHNCFRSQAAPPSWASKFLLRHCLPDSAVRAGFYWLQFDLEASTLGKYMNDATWMGSLLHGSANSPLNAIEVAVSDHWRMQRYDRGTFRSTWQERDIILGADGALYTQKLESGAPLKKRVDLAEVDPDAILGPHMCDHNSMLSCVSVANEIFGMASNSDGQAWVSMLKNVSSNLRQAQQRWPLLEVRRLLHQMLLGLQELSNARIVHGDIKPDNILVPSGLDSEPRNLRFTDMGFASSPSFANFRRPPGATAHYAPPELLAADNAANAQDTALGYDTFSVGLIAFELLTGSRLITCAVDSGWKDMDFLVLPKGYVSYEPRPYNREKTYGVKQFQNLPLLLQLLQVLGLPDEDVRSLPIASPGNSSQNAVYGNPYGKFNKQDLAANLRVHNTFWLERALFAVQAAISGKFEDQENRRSFSSLRRGLLSSSKYTGSKLTSCAKKLLQQRGIDFTPSHLEALSLVESMLQVLPQKRIGLADALAHPWLAPARLA